MDWKLAKSIIDLHKQYNSSSDSETKNWYLEILDRIADEMPDTDSEVGDLQFKYDELPYMGADKELEAREMAVGLLTTWIDDLKRIRSEIQG